MENLKKLGIIAGKGNLPLIIVEECKKNNVEPVCVLIEGFANPEDYKGINQISLPIGLVGSALEFLAKNKITDLVCASGVQKPS